MTEPLKKKLGHAIVCPFEQYVDEKKKFFDLHPNAKVVEEIKTLMIGQVEVPDPQIIGRTRPGQALMIMWAIVYEEKVNSIIPQLQHG